jgi:drug/metabolite transporter (DMT)-like permease
MTINKELWGWLYGFLGVLIFSLTLPATRIAVTELDPVFLGLGRTVIAGGLAIILLAITRQSIPPTRFWLRFTVVAVGVVVGFPLLTAIAMRDAPASYGAVITGLIPLATVLYGVWRGKDQVTKSFWFFALIGSGLVVIFAMQSGIKSLRATDLALFGAVVAAGVGYGEGAILARTFGAWQVICWTLVLSLPVLLPIAINSAPTSFNTISFNAWLGFFYLGVFSMFIGFFAWYQGLVWGGIAKVSQIQLLQPFLTILASACLLHEALTIRTTGFAVGVIICVALSKRF